MKYEDMNDKPKIRVKAIYVRYKPYEKTDDNVFYKCIDKFYIESELSNR